MAARARSGSMPWAIAACMASAERGSKMPMARMDWARRVRAASLAASLRPSLPDAMRARASSFRAALAWPMP